MFVIVEASFSTTIWCRRIMNGLRCEARKKRINLNVVHSESGILSDPAGQVIVVGADEEWLRHTITLIRQKGKHPIILGNVTQGFYGEGVSSVSADAKGSMGAICSYLEKADRSSPALFAINPNSLSDKCRQEAFIAFGGNEKNIFLNEGSLEECFARFYEKHRKTPYRSVICANDFAAISLIRHLKEHNADIDSIFIISYSNTLISHCFSPSVSTVMMNFESFGQLAFMIIDCLNKSDSLSGIHMQSTWQILHRETTDILPLSDIANPEPTNVSSDDGFYSDPELSDMMRIEPLLTESDTTDLQILSAILDEKKLTEIEGICFLTETAVKYRIKKMKDICLVDSRVALKSLLDKYLPEKNAILRISQK